MNETNVLDVYNAALQKTYELDTPDKEMVKALVKTALNHVALAMQNNDAKSALDTADKLGAIERYIKAKVAQNQSDLLTQNIIGVARARILKELGLFADKYFPHGGEAGKHLLGSTEEYFGYSQREVWEWRIVGRMSEDDFNKWSEYYLDGGVGKNKEFVWAKLIGYLRPKGETTERFPYNPTLEEWIQVGSYLLQEWVHKVTKGELSRESVRPVVDKLKLLAKTIISTMRQVGELY